MAARREIRQTKSKAPWPIKLGLVLIIALFVFNSARFLYQKAQLESRRKELLSLIEEEEGKKQLYIEELSKVGTKEYYEYLARKQLGFIYPGEKVMILTDGTKQQ